MVPKIRPVIDCGYAYGLLRFFRRRGLADTVLLETGAEFMPAPACPLPVNILDPWNGFRVAGFSIVTTNIGQTNEGAETRKIPKNVLEIAGFGLIVKSLYYS
jgi:hypothetical protein